MSKAERVEKAQEAVAMSARGVTLTAIGEVLGVSRQTASKLVQDELANRAEHRAADKERAVARYEEIIRAAWERFENTDNRSLNASGYLNTIRSAQERIDKITGAEAPIKHQDVDEEVEVVWDDANDFQGTEG
ncbi:MAG: hypothetical protein CYG60_15575 [Actinobacteria bacterium]|nr:MAG: hypothetical protein CYG60_15575 [Actinomycetota bacterium]